MEEFSITGAVFDRVPDGVSKIQDGAEAGIGFVLADNIRLDLAAARDDGRQSFGIALEQLGQALFMLRELNRIVNNAVFDDLGQTGNKLPLRQSCQRIHIAQHKLRLIKRANQIFARL